jgi:carboxylate-amine ligase
VRSPCAQALAALADQDLSDLEARVRKATRSHGVVFGGAAEERDFLLDPVPRVFSAEEWAALEHGLTQRVRALDAFCADAHGERRAIAAGVLPERILEDAPFLERDLIEARTAQEPWIAIAGLDVVRDAEGKLRVLEDNLRTPSGMAYALAARQIVMGELGLAEGELPGGLAGGPCEIAVALRELLGGVLAPRPPLDDPDGLTVLLTDGPENSAFYEHRVLAELLELPLVEPGDLRRRGERLWLREQQRPVSVVYRRTDEERLRLPDGTLTPIGELSLQPLRAGTLRVLNGFGTGVADDKLVYRYVERMIDFYLEEETAISSVATYDLGVAEEREEALGRLEELVVKPRDGHGGTGVLVGPRADRAELAEARREVERDPSHWLAQETVMLSTHPTVIDGALAPRHVDLRPFVFYDGAEAKMLPGGLTRVALDEGCLVVNSSRRGGGKDTWVLR